MYIPRTVYIMQVNLVFSVQGNRENTFELSEVQDKQILMSLKYSVQAFRFMVGSGYCPKIWPITFQGSRGSGPILFSCEKISL